MRDKLRWQIIKHFSKYGYRTTLKKHALSRGWTKADVESALQSKICEKRYNRVLRKYTFLNDRMLTAKVPATTHITKKNFCGQTIYYIHNDTVLSVFYNGKYILLVNPKMANICFKSAMQLLIKEDDYYGINKKE